MSTPRVAAVHDLSAFGRCSMTVVMPTLSAMGVQCCPLLTAYLSTHTGGFTGNTFLDLTDQMGPVAAHWQEEHVTFDGIYTGFLGSFDQIRLTADFIRAFRGKNNFVVVDPVMGDHGRPYRTYTPEMCAAMGELTALADVITPNRTEAAILLGEDYGALRLDTPEEAERRTRALSREGRCSVVLTGVSLSPDTIGAACFDREAGETAFVSAPKVPGSCHGTGDLFSAVLTGALARGRTLQQAAQAAADFVARCVERTRQQDYPAREGVDFEPLLWQLGREFYTGGNER